MVGCYIIRSDKLGKFYIGVTQDDVVSRIKKHNDGSYGKHVIRSPIFQWGLPREIMRNVKIYDFISRLLRSRISQPHEIHTNTNYLTKTLNGIEFSIKMNFPLIISSLMFSFF